MLWARCFFIALDGGVEGKGNQYVLCPLTLVSCQLCLGMKAVGDLLGIA